MAKRVKELKFSELSEGSRFSFPKNGSRGRRPIFTKVGSRAYENRVGEKVQHRALSSVVEVMK